MDMVVAVAIVMVLADRLRTQEPEDVALFDSWKKPANI